MLNGLPLWLTGKESNCNAGDLGLITGSGRSPGQGNGNPLDWRIPWTEESGSYSPEGGKELDMTEVTTNKASGGDGIPAELLQILKGDVVKVLHSICQQIWKTQQWPQD